MKFTAFSSHTPSSLGAPRRLLRQRPSRLEASPPCNCRRDAQLLTADHRHPLARHERPRRPGAGLNLVPTLQRPSLARNERKEPAPI
jgi:hypothetical protein